MPPASLLDLLAPLIFGCRQWWRATRHDPQYYELDLIA